MQFNIAPTCGELLYIAVRGNGELLQGTAAGRW